MVAGTAWKGEGGLGTATDRSRPPGRFSGGGSVGMHPLTNPGQSSPDIASPPSLYTPSPPAASIASSVSTDTSPASPTVPAVLVARPDTAGLPLVALPLLDRLLVATHRAGFNPIVIVSERPLPPLPRSTAWNIPFSVLPTVPPIQSPTLLASTDQHLTAADLRQLLQDSGRLVSIHDIPLPAGIVTTTPTQPSGSDPWSHLPHRKAGPVARPITDAHSAREAGEALWASLNSNVDGAVDRWFNRPVGRRLLSRWLVHTAISPNQISCSATLIGVFAGLLFTGGSPRIAIAAALLFQISAIIDCVDGDVARAVFKESPLGKWLDIVGDQVVHAAIFGGIAIGLWRSQPDGPHLWLGASAVLGGILSFLVVLRGLRDPSRITGRLQTLIDKATNRDFSVLVLILALFDRLGWFLWLTAIGSHAFWIIALAIQATSPRPPSRTP